VLGLALIISSAILIDQDSLYPYWLGLFPTIGTVLIIIANQQLGYYAGLVGVGLISYPLYLWHWVIISFCYIYLGKKPNTESFFFAIGVSFLLSYLTYKYIERLRHTKSNKILISLILIAISVGIGGKLIKHYNGIPSRSHLSYFEKYSLEFKRTPATDEVGNSYVSSIIQENREFNYCRANFNEKNSKLVAVIGDSHAHAIFPGIAEVANKNGYDTILLANSSCPTLIQFMWGRNPKEINICQTKIRQILKVLELDKRIEKVVLVTRGPVYMHGDFKGTFTKETIINSSNNFLHPDRQTYETYFSGFKKTLSQLNKFDNIKDVYYFLENPELDFLPKEVIPRPFDFWGVSIQDSTVDRELYRLRMEKYRSLVFEKSSYFSNVHIVDVEPYMCEGDKCLSYKNGNFLYADDDHFSVFGSLYIARKTEHIIFEKSNEYSQQ